jgi:type IV pilus assembly protein PilA
MISRMMGELTARRNSLKEKEKGFTLIELLVVVVIIGILAAIAIPVYLGVQNSAKDSTAKSDLVNAKTAVVAYETDNNSALPAGTLMNVTGLGTYGFTLSNGLSTPAEAVGYSLAGVITTTAPAGPSFCIKALSTTGKSFYVTDTTGVVAATTAPTGC